MTNTQRADRAREGFEASPYFNSNAADGLDSITDLYDFVCDLLHLADRVAADDWHSPDADESMGEYVARMALWHYTEELAEEREDDAA